MLERRPNGANKTNRSPENEHMRRDRQQRQPRHPRMKPRPDPHLEPGRPHPAGGPDTVGDGRGLPGRAWIGVLVGEGVNGVVGIGVSGVLGSFRGGLGGRGSGRVGGPQRRSSSPSAHPAAVAGRRVPVRAAAELTTASTARPGPPRRVAVSPAAGRVRSRPRRSRSRGAGT